MLFDLLGLNLSETAEYWIPQIISILGMAVQVLSFQFKNNKTYLYLQGSGSILFAISFFMIDGGLASALGNIIGVCMCFTFAHYNKKHFNRGMLILFIVLYGISNAASMIAEGEFQVMAVFLFLAETVGVISIWTDSARIIRLSTLCFISPVWIINSIIYFSIGGILCQIFAITSNVISIIRYGWKEIDDPNSTRGQKKSKEA